MATDARRNDDRRVMGERQDDGAQRLQSLIEAGRKLEAVLRQSVTVGSRRAA
jgi:hypothetical protein